MSTEGLEAFFGTWTMVRDEGFEDYLAAVGVNFIIRKIAMKMKTKIEIVKKGENGIQMITKSPKHIENYLEIGAEVNDLDGFANKIKIRTSWDSTKNVLTVESNPAEGSKFKRNIVDRRITAEGELVEDISLPDESLVCHRYFSREK